MKRILSLMLVLLLCLSLGGCGVAKDEYETLVSANEELKIENDSLKSQVKDLNAELKEINEMILVPQLKEEASPIIEAIGAIGEVSLDKEELINNVQTQYDGISSKAKEYVTNYNLLKEGHEKIEELRAAQSEEEKSQEYKSACGWYSYQDISRDPDSYVGNKAVFTGEVVQVQESGLNVVLRVDVTKGKYYWTDTIYVTYTYPGSGQRILEDDIITLYGELNGIKTYQTVMGSSISIPHLKAKYIELN